MKPDSLARPATLLAAALLALLPSTRAAAQTQRSLRFDGSVEAVVTYEHRPEFDSRAELTVEVVSDRHLVVHGRLAGVRAR